MSSIVGLRITIIINSLAVGGVQRLVVDQANELARQGAHVRIIFLEEDVRDGLDTELDRAVCVQRIAVKGNKDLLGFVRLWRHVCRERSDVVMTHMWLANNHGRLAAWCARVPCIAAFEHSIYDTKKPLHQFLADRLLQYCGDVIAVSHAVASSLTRHGICANRISVVPNGICLNRYMGAVHEMKRHHVGRTFIFVGRLVGDKMVHIPIEAATSLPDVRLLVVGQGPEQNALVRVAERGAYPGNVIFLGVRKDVPQLLLASDCLVLPSIREGFGLVIVEAYACGLPVIVSGVHGTRELVEHDKTGLIVDGSVREWMAAMEKMTSDHKLRARLSISALAQAGHYSIESHVRQLVKVLTR